MVLGDLLLFSISLFLNFLFLYTSKVNDHHDQHKLAEKLTVTVNLMNHSCKLGASREILMPLSAVREHRIQYSYVDVESPHS